MNFINKKQTIITITFCKEFCICYNLISFKMATPGLVHRMLGKKLNPRKQKILDRKVKEKEEQVLHVFLNTLKMTIFSSDQAPIFPRDCHIEYKDIICWRNEWLPKLKQIYRSLLAFLDNKCISPDKLKRVDVTIFKFFRSMYETSKMSEYVLISFLKTYKSETKALLNYPRIDVLFKVINRSESPNMNTCNVEQFLMRDKITPKMLLRYFPGSYELDIPKDVLIEKIGLLSQLHAKFIVDKGLIKFLETHPGVIISSSDESKKEKKQVNPSNKEASSDNTIVLDLERVSHEHLSVSFCKCKTISDIARWLSNLLRDPGLNVTTDKYPHDTMPPKTYTQSPLMVLCCGCGEKITWDKIYTAYFHYFSDKIYIARIFEKLHAKLAKKYESLTCMDCCKAQPLLSMFIFGCENKHICLCLTCYDTRVQRIRTMTKKSGFLLELFAFKCLECNTYIRNLCNIFSSTLWDMLQRISINEQIRICWDCDKLFHGVPECGGNIPTTCASCASLKVNMREVFNCPNCDMPAVNEGGCDLRICGSTYVQSSGWEQIHQDIGCGQSFCVGCFQQFDKDILVDWQCSCLVKNSSPKQYIPFVELDSDVCLCSERYEDVKDRVLSRRND